jgi:hypothetical protein
MAIDTDAKKLSLLTLNSHFQAALPATGTLNQADLQHMLWGYIDPLWSEIDVASGAVCITFSTGTQSTVTFGTATQADITFGTGTQATIAFGEGSCP